MQPKATCVLLLLLALALGTWAQGSGETCVVEPKSRANCGFSGITSAQCRHQGCCFDDTVPGYPWCFHPAKVQPAEEDDCPF